MRDACILGIETSCDETAAAVVRSGQRLLSNVVSSQIATHQPYGGVVPELASREHLRAIVPVVRQALADAGQTYQSVDAVAVTRGPGLAGALLVGISYAKALAYALEKPLITVNHLEGHIHAVLLEERQKQNFHVEFPVLALVVSGGHTHLFLAEEKEHGWKYENIGRTRDDAAGEAYDKVAKLLGLGYPGGPVIDALAKHGNPRAVKFGPALIKHPNRGTPKVGERGESAASRERSARAKQRSVAEPSKKETQTAFDFSFSGIKTAVLRYVQTEKMSSAIEARRQALEKISEPRAADILPLCDQETLDLVASFQRAVVDDLVAKTLFAARECQASTLFVTGGVAANSALREKFEVQAALEGLPVYFPSRQLSTDNAAMIAAAAYPKFVAGDFAGKEFSAEASLAL
ncbi:MAG TPA: tRNA (adenosine(37)-N6)-threonylcarbamoyltransferase complex transferase subunit TsaD [Candidatus Angelobacter sp.]|nr:tRNA (adenosine(37)-N6)-threonylcarbamoyltransferase complex transferase subunit TsaD [Candidatus Angelobacter sp.]